jgi:outer membrane protease
LLWHFEPLVYAGVDLRYNWEVSFDLNIFANSTFKYGFPGKTGVVEDSDWTDSRYADWLTHYSVSENHTKTALLFDVDTGVSFVIADEYWLKAFIAYRFMHYAWVAKGGAFLYPDGMGGHFYMAELSDVGTYQQTWHVISPGISFYGAMGDYFDIEISLKVSPFVWVNAIDEHLLRNLVVTEDLTGGLFIEPGLLFSFKPNDLMILSLSFSYRNISGTRGDSTYNEEGYPEFVAKNMGGAGYSAFDVGIIARFTIGSR